MDIFKKPEHQICHFYKTSPTCFFQSFQPEAGVIYKISRNPNTILLFLLEGELAIDCDSYHNRLLKANEIALFPVGSRNSVYIMHNSHLISCAFSVTAQVCNQVHLESLYAYKQDIRYDYTILPMQGEIPAFLNLLHLYLKNKIGCPRMQEDKLEELSILFRNYYTKKELASFFYPIINRNLSFNQFVLSHYQEVTTVEELATMAHISLSAFNRKFKHYFNQSAYRWILDKRGEGVLEDIRSTRKSFLEISLDWNFSSQSHLTKFTKQKYGLSPTQIREQAAASSK